MTAGGLSRNAHGRLVWTDAGGTAHDGVTPVRAFPLTAPDAGVSLVGTDGHELAWLPRLAEVPDETRALLQAALAEREFAPEVRRLVAVSSYSTPSTWTVETDRGPTRFVLKGEEDIRRIGRTRLLITTGDGMHYTVPDLTALDRPSRRLLERFL